jgi:hypothetical protein
MKMEDTMRIEYKEEKQEQVEETPRTYESDLTPKEKRRKEWENLKGLPWQKRLGHLWAYYKFLFIIPVIVLAVAATAIQIYRNSLEEQILYVNISETALDTDDSQEQLSQDLLALCGSGGKHEQVSVTSNMISSQDYNSSVLMSVWLSTGEMDLVITDESTYNRFQEQEIFINIEEEFPEAYAQLKDHMEGNVVYLDQSPWENYGLVEYEPVYAGILITSTHKEAAVEALLYLCGEKES